MNFKCAILKRIFDVLLYKKNLRQMAAIYWVILCIVSSGMGLRILELEKTLEPTYKEKKKKKQAKQDRPNVKL